MTFAIQIHYLILRIVQRKEKISVYHMLQRLNIVEFFVFHCSPTCSFLLNSASSQESNQSEGLPISLINLISHLPLEAPSGPVCRPSLNITIITLSQLINWPHP